MNESFVQFVHDEASVARLLCKAVLGIIGSRLYAKKKFRQKTINIIAEWDSGGSMRLLSAKPPRYL